MKVNNKVVMGIVLTLMVGVVIAVSANRSNEITTSGENEDLIMNCSGNCEIRLEKPVVIEDVLFLDTQRWWDNYTNYTPEACAALTGSADLCDGDDGGGAASGLQNSVEWVEAPEITSNNSIVGGKVNVTNITLDRMISRRGDSDYSGITLTSDKEDAAYVLIKHTTDTSGDTALSFRNNDNDTMRFDLTLLSDGLRVYSAFNAGKYIYPHADNAYQLGTADKKWSDVQSVLIQGADYGFENELVLTECMYKRRDDVCLVEGKVPPRTDFCSGQGCDNTKGRRIITSFRELLDRVELLESKISSIE